MQREGSHATPSASATTTSSLSGTFDIFVQNPGIIRRVTESSRVALFRVLGLRPTQRSVAGDVRVMFFNLMLQTRRFAWYTPRKHGRCGGDESGS